MGERRRGVAERVVVAIAGGILLTLAGAIGWLWLQPRDPAQLNVDRPEVVRQVNGQPSKSRLRPTP